MTTSDQADSKTQRSILEVSDSVTGHEELEVTQFFGRPLGDLQLADGAMWARALVYLLKRREKVTDVDAYAQVLDLAIKDVWSTFANESVESGKDEQPSEARPESSQPSAP